MVRTDQKVAIIGAGMAGLSCAQEMTQRGIDVVVFDKGRGLGGRMATRRADGGFQFDHGAQYLSPRGAAFRAMLADAQTAGAVMPWPGVSDDLAFVGVPGMTGLAKHLGRGLTIRTETRVDGIAQAGGRWNVVWDSGAAAFDRVVITAPAPQIGALLPQGHGFGAQLESVTMDPCLTLMIGVSRAGELPFVSRRAPHKDIAWIVCDSDKPQRPDATCIVAQASTDWSLRHLELDRDMIAQKMLPLVTDLIGADLMGDPAYVVAHRWRYAFVSRPLGQPFLMNDDETLFAGGDWCLGPHAEDAWSSGQAIARKIAQTV